MPDAADVVAEAVETGPEPGNVPDVPVPAEVDVLPEVEGDVDPPAAPVPLELLAPALEAAAPLADARSWPGKARPT